MDIVIHDNGYEDLLIHPRKIHCIKVHVLLTLEVFSKSVINYAIQLNLIRSAELDMFLFQLFKIPCYEKLCFYSK